MDISTIIVALIVLLALTYLVRHFHGIVSGKSGCSCGGSCSSCHGGASGHADDDGVPPCCRGKKLKAG